MLARGGIAVLGLVLAACGHGHANPEMAATRVIHEIGGLQREFRDQAGRYGSLDEIRAFAAKRGRTLALLPADYDFEVTGGADEFEIRAEPKPGSWQKKLKARKSFYVDESLVIRQSWGPDPAGKDSEELR